MEKRDIFLSHSVQDRDRAEELALKLGKERCWLYEREVIPGDPIFKFDQGIANSRVFVLFWSKDAASSHWVKEEIYQARMRLVHDERFRFVAVKLDATPLPEGLACRVYIDAAKGLDYVRENLESVL